MSNRPCPEGFHWIGQPLTACDQCGQPAWDHDGWAEITPPLRSPWDDPKFALRPWHPGERERVRERWDRGAVEVIDIAVTWRWKGPPFLATFTYNGNQYTIARWTPWAARYRAEDLLRGLEDRAYEARWGRRP